MSLALLFKSMDNNIRTLPNPDRYVDHIYGEKEAGGTGVLYLSAIPFAELGFPEVPHHKMSQDAERVMKVIPWWVAGLGVVLTGTYALTERRKRIAAELATKEPQAQQAGGEL